MPGGIACAHWRPHRSSAVHDERFLGARRRHGGRRSWKDESVWYPRREQANHPSSLTLPPRDRVSTASPRLALPPVHRVATECNSDLVLSDPAIPRRAQRGSSPKLMLPWSVSQSQSRKLRNPDSIGIAALVHRRCPRARHSARGLEHIGCPEVATDQRAEGSDELLQVLGLIGRGIREEVTPSRALVELSAPSHRAAKSQAAFNETGKRENLGIRERIDRRHGMHSKAPADCRRAARPRRQRRCQRAADRRLRRRALSARR